MKINGDYVYEIIKRKPIRIDRLPALIPEEKRQVKLTPYMKEKEAFWSTKKIEFNQRKRICITCGQTAAYVAYFEIENAQIIEKYCDQCLDKWVYIDDPTILNTTK